MKTSQRLLIAFLFPCYLFAQQNIVCAVKYKDYTTNLGTFNYWFYPNKLIAQPEANYRVQFMNGFPVLVNGVMKTETDTVKYNKAFNEFIQDITAQMSKKPMDTKLKEYQSTITKTNIFLLDIKKNYIVIDSVEKMDSWIITNEKTAFMGFTCQKATINYKGEKYYAWFTTQLPYNAGPDNFCGLPGLILKVGNQSGSVGFEAIEILTPFLGVVPNFNADGTYLSRKEWVEFIRNFNKKAREARQNMIQQEKKNTATNN